MRFAFALSGLLLAAPLTTATLPAVPAEATSSTAWPSASEVVGDRQVGFRPIHPDEGHGVITPAAATPGRRADRSPVSTAGSPGDTGRPVATALTTGPVAVPSDVTVVGVTWAEGTGADARVEYRVERDGVWQAWVQADVQTCTRCVEPATSPRAGSEAIALTGVSRVEARITSDHAVDLPRLAVIDPESDASQASEEAPEVAPDSPSRKETDVTQPVPVSTAPRSTTTGAAGATSETTTEALTPFLPTLTTKPANTTATPALAALPAAPATTIRDRATWRAQNTSTSRSLPRIAPRGVVVHHTAGTNSYTPGQVPSILRGIQRFHVRDRGWSDIGYNVLVDRFGRAWQGRPGGFTHPRQGAHASGVNRTYLGIAYLGDTSARAATSKGVATMTDLIGWASARYGFSTTGSLRVNGKSEPVVAGHYQVGSTTCPGRDLTRKLPTMRQRAKAKAADYRS